MSILGYFYAYILGGVTFIPLVVTVFVLMHPKVLMKPGKHDTKHGSLLPHELNHDSSTTGNGNKRGRGRRQSELGAISLTDSAPLLKGDGDSIDNGTHPGRSHSRTSSVFNASDDERPDTDTEGEQEDEDLKAGKVEENQNSGLLAYKSGWITVTQEYVESTDDISSATQSINETPDNKSAYSALYKLVKNNNTSGTNNNSNNNGSGVPESIDSLDQTAVSSNTKSNNNHGNGGEKLRNSVRKHRFYAVLKHGNLFLYKNQTLNDVKHVIVLSNQLITIWPRNLIDGQLFTKYTAICLIKKDWTRSRRLSENFDHENLTVDDILDPKNDLSPPKSSFFIHCDTNIDKEDWYFALIRSSKTNKNNNPSGPLSHLNPNIYAETLHFNTSEMIDLIQSLYSSEGNLQTKWFNAILGRIFLGLKDTDILHNYLVEKIITKLNKIKTPGFLEKFSLKGLDPGHSIPFFTYPNLKEINPNGTVVVSTYVHYHGSISCNLATKVNLSLGGRFQKSLSQSVDVLLKVTLEKLEGPLIFKIKPPPSNRIWYCFEIEPIMNLKIEPIISSRQFTYNILTSLIEKRFKDAIKDSLVAPHYDDIVFYKTNDELFRGGIWNKSTRPESQTNNNNNSHNNKSPVDSYGDFNSNPEFVHTNSASNLSPPTKEDYEMDEKSMRSFDTKSDSKTIDSKIDDKVKLSNTLSDLSKRIRKAKSSHTVSVNGGNFLSDGSLIETTNNKSKTSNTNPQVGSSRASSINETTNNNTPLGKTWKKLGDWYSNTSANINANNNNNGSQNIGYSSSQEYHKPEMILSRRKPRNSSTDIPPMSSIQTGWDNSDNPDLISMTESTPMSAGGSGSRRSSNIMTRNGSNSFSNSSYSNQNTPVGNDNAFEMFVKPSDYNSVHSHKGNNLSVSSTDDYNWNDLMTKRQPSLRSGNYDADEANIDLDDGAQGFDEKSESNADDLDSRIHEELIRLESEFNSKDARLRNESLLSKEKPFDTEESESGETTQRSIHGTSESQSNEQPKLHRKSPPPL